MKIKQNLIFFALLFSIFGSSLIYTAMSQKSTLSMESYGFMLKIVPRNESAQLSIQNFRFEYNFSEEIGIIRFETREEEIEILLLYFPFDISERDVSLNVYERIGYNNYTKLKVNYEKCNSQKENMYCIKENHLLVYDLDKGNKDYLFEIKHNISLKPNAIFDFAPDNSINQDDYAFGLFLGDHYECIGQCYINLRATYERYDSAPQYLKIRFENNKEPQYRFKITSKFIKPELDKDFMLPMGITLLFFGLSLIFQFFIIKEDAQDHKNREKRLSRKLLKIKK